MKSEATKVVKRLLAHHLYAGFCDSIVAAGGRDLARSAEAFGSANDARRKQGIFFLGIDGHIAVRTPGFEDGPDAAWLPFLAVAATEGIVGPQHFSVGKHCKKAADVVAAAFVMHPVPPDSPRRQRPRKRICPTLVSAIKA